ncbi:MAG: peptidoglycan-binding protein [Patescibacteria group bacterium]|nr:peptidoglycan-binding protein [Patescibacteria group bacterium]
MTESHGKIRCVITKFTLVIGATVAFWFLGINSVSAANVSVVLPNGGECLTVGTKFTIEIASDANHVALYYRADGAQPAHLDSSLIKHPLQQTTWGWTPSTDDISETGRIWVEGHLNNHNSTGDWDDSNADFAVRADCSGGNGGNGGNGGGGSVTSAGGKLAHRPEIEIISPKKGVFNDSIKIDYKATDKNDELGQENLGLGSAPVSIFYSKSTDVIRLKKLIAKNLPAVGLYDWDITDIPDRDDYAIIIEATDNSKEVGQAISETFSIDSTVPVVKVYSSGAEISWLTKNKTYSFIEYGPISNEYTSRTDFDTELTKEYYALIENLTASTTYYFRTIAGRAFDKEITVSEEFSFSTPLSPTQVSGLFGVAGASTTLLSWINPPDSDFQETAIVRRGDRFAKNQEDGEVIFRGDETYYRDSTLTNGTTYYYSIFSINSNNNVSLPVNITLTPKDNLLPAPAPPPPEDDSTSTLSRVRAPSSEPGENAVTLRWRNPESENFLGIQIIRNEDSLPANAFDGKVIFRGRTEIFKDSGLMADKRYFYGIFVFGWTSNFSSAALTASVTQPLTQTPEPLTSSTSLQEFEEFIIENKPKIIQTDIAKLQNKIKELSSLTEKELGMILSEIKEILNKIKEVSMFVVPEKIEEKPSRITKTLQFGAEDEEVRTLQEILRGFPDIYPEGITTGYFGELTRRAIQRLQTSFGIASSGDETTSGYGLVGSKTRIALNALKERKVQTVIIEPEKFNPKTTIIPVGGIVRWINNDTNVSWPAADIHDTHSNYPESGGCISSAFDACRDLQKGEDYYFIFNIPGTWEYHDHVKPDRVGEIIVK